MKSLTLFFITSAGLLAQQFTHYMGLPTPQSVSTQAQSATATWISYSLLTPNACAVQKIKVYVSAVNGTLGANDLVAEIYDDSGQPGTSQSTSNTVTATPTGAAWVEFTGFSAGISLSANTLYWLVLKNANGTPASNFPTYRYFGYGVANGISYGPASRVKTTANSGTLWNNPSSLVAGAIPPIRVECSGSVFFGHPIYDSSSSGASTYSSYRVASNAEAGVQFVAQANANLNVKACLIATNKTGTPTGNARCRIYSGTSGTLTLVATSDTTLPGTYFDSSQRHTPFYFNTPVTLTAGTTYKVVLSETNNSDVASTDRYGMWIAGVDSNANSTALLPFSGTLKGAYCASSCTTAANWTTDAGAIPSVGILLDPTTPFASTGGGASQKAFGSVK